MKNNEANVTVNADLNMSDVKKELDIFFNTTVKKVKTEVDSSKLVNAIKDFKIKDLVPLLFCTLLILYDVTFIYKPHLLNACFFVLFIV